MPKRTNTTMNKVISRLCAVNPWHLAGITILAEIITLVMNTLMGILWWGRISYELITIGTVDALVASVVVGTIVLYIIEQLRETDKKYRELVEHANSIILRMDADGNITYFNEFAEGFFGFSKEQIMGRSVVGTIVPEEEITGRDLDFMIQDICSNPLQYGVNVNENMKKDGTRVWVSWTNKPVYDNKGSIREILCIGNDVTEAKRAEETLRKYRDHLETLVQERTSELATAVSIMQSEIAERETAELALRESEERFREIFEQNEDALLLLERSTGDVMDANPEAVDLFGFTRREFISEGLPLILRPQEHEQFKDKLLGIEDSGRLRFPRIPSRTKDGTAITLSVWGKSVRLKKSNVIFCSFRDITEKIRLEEEAKFLHSKLIQNDKMISLGMLVSGIAHEINNPNHLIMANAQMVSDVWKEAATVLSDRYREQGDFLLAGVPFSEMRYMMPQLLMAMYEGADRIKNIVDNLKDFSRQGRKDLDMAVDVNKIIAVSAALMSSQISRHTDCFELREGVDLPLARGNKQQLEQVVINLVMNALQSLRDRSGAVIVSTCFDKEADSILIRVKDEGIGIPEEILMHITEPFFTTRNDQDGTGLGLSISDSIIKDHKGSLTFLSEPGKGTTVTVALPAFHSITERNSHATDRIS